MSEGWSELIYRSAVKSTLTGAEFVALVEKLSGRVVIYRTSIEDISTAIFSIKTLTDLSDVIISLPANYHVLAYDSPSETWINTTIASIGDSRYYTKDEVDILLSGNPVATASASQPASPVLGMLYTDTDDNNLYFYNGSTWERCNIPRQHVITITIDGGGSAITTGLKSYGVIPFDCTITNWRMIADQSGSIQIDIWKDTWANHPPTVADTITASAKPTLSTAIQNSDSTLTGWTTACTAGDTLAVYVDSASTVTYVQLQITLQY